MILPAGKKADRPGGPHRVSSGSMRWWSVPSSGVAIDRPELSVCCGLDCAVTPALIGAAVASPFGRLLNKSMEVLSLAAATGTAAVSLGPRYWGRHGRKRWRVLFATANLVDIRLWHPWVLCETREPAA